MNKRITELISQSNFQLLTPRVNTELSLDFQEKELHTLAELIIRECASVAWFAEQYNLTDRPISVQIKEHFGVKE